MSGLGGHRGREDLALVFSRLWQRLTVGFRGTSEWDPARAEPAPADERPGPDPDVSPRVHERGRDEARLVIAEAEEDSDEQVEAVRVALNRSLEWRARVLLERVSGNSRLADGAAVVTSLRSGGEGVIRQIPFAAQQALAVSRNQNSSVSDLVRLFERDPTLTQSLLKTANSSWHLRGADPVVSISVGVQRIGMQAVENLLLASIVEGMLCRPGSAYATLVSRVWSHMLRTASLAQWLAPAFRVDPETAYTLALLHDVGKLVVFDYISALRRDLRREVRMPESFLLQMLMHVHEPLGGQAALRWGLGTEAACALAGHHRHPAPETPDLLTELLYVAERVDLVTRARFETLDWQAIWSDGMITTDRAEVEERYAVAQE